jgi:hypothetical protein
MLPRLQILKINAVTMPQNENYLNIGLYASVYVASQLEG